jgi:hypothetical protein
LAALLVLAFLLAQALGSMHRLAHADGPQQHAHERGGHGLTAGLFDAHHEQADCRLFDQLTHSDAAPAATRVAAEAPAGAPPGRFAEALRASSLPSDCRVRGPPAA